MKVVNIRENLMTFFSNANFTKGAKDVWHAGNDMHLQCTLLISIQCLNFSWLQMSFNHTGTCTGMKHGHTDRHM
mgnify:CR=1 FL=1